MNVDQYDYCILGAGLAGVSLAKELVCKGYAVCLIDKDHIGAGASGVPLGLANYATGRFAKKVWEAEASYNALLENLEQASQFSDSPFYKVNGVLRPAMDEKIANRMLINFQETAWDNSWAEWLTPSQLKEMNSFIKPDLGGLWLPKAITIEVTSYLKNLVASILSQGSKVYEHLTYSYRKENDSWFIESDEHTIVTQNLIICSGAGSSEFEAFSDYPLHSVKGQLIVMRKENEVPFSHSISALGYMASLDRQHFVIGSTYEHQYDHNTFDEAGREHLVNIVQKAIPFLLKDATIVNSWTGIRVSAPNRMPVLGSHPTQENLYLFSGLASKGLLFSTFLSNRFAEYLTKDTPLPPEVDIQRLKMN